MSRCSSLIATAGILALTSCATKLGPKTIPGARFDYNETITRSLNEQLLLNLVRLRYRDTPLFIDVGSVIAQYEWAGNVSANPTIDIDGATNNEYPFGLGGAYAETPTITYEPVRGAAAAQRLLAPIDPATLALLSQSGWSIERLLLCCVQEINGVENAASATGPAPSAVPDNTAFRGLAAKLRALQEARLLRVRPLLDKGAPGVAMILRDDPSNPAVTEAREILGLAAGVEEFRLTPQLGAPGDDQVGLAGRSLLGVFFFLSLTVEPPPAHVTEGLVGGGDLDWSQVTGGLLQVHSAASAPPRAFVRIRYRDHWFYIDDADLQSKATFNLLTYLYSLQAAGSERGSPLLTVPVR